jgi:hypothetical protein
LRPQNRSFQGIAPFSDADKSLPMTAKIKALQQLEVSLQETAHGFESHPLRQPVSPKKMQAKNIA